MPLRDPSSNGEFSIAFRTCTRLGEKGMIRCDNAASTKLGGPNSIDDSRRSSSHKKPNLTVREQIAHLKSQGVTLGFARAGPPGGSALVL